MFRRISFERRLLLALVLFSLVPSLVLLAVGAGLLSRSVALHTSPATWEHVRESAQPLLERVETSEDPVLRRAAAEHRAALSASLLQAGRWDYVSQRVLSAIPVVALVLAALLAWLAVRAAGSIARGFARPIHELVGWSELVARDEPLPPPDPGDPAEQGEFAALRNAFRAMSRELAVSRARALEAERTRTWVAMARGVAHELKNSLTPLRLGVRTLQRSVAGDARADEPLEVIAAEADRLERLARSFSQFGRLPEGPTSEVDLCEQLTYLVRTHLPPQIEHRLLAPDDLPRIHGHHDALARAWINLLLNAADAMGENGGTLTIKLTTLGEDNVEIRFLDEGSGLRDEDLSRLWEPDFTTKPQGTGLGLALVRQTIHAHGGGIWARNRPEGGAEFRVVLPRDSASGSYES